MAASCITCCASLRPDSKPRHESNKEEQTAENTERMMGRKRRDRRGTRQPGDRAPARSAILEVVENQIRENNPPEATATLERLMGTGVSRDEAVGYIASALVAELHDVLTSGEPYEESRYLAHLNRLPTLPWE